MSQKWFPTHLWWSRNETLKSCSCFCLLADVCIFVGLF
ncbi:hypothetical protein LHGZ1_1248 [Laribacter hongkongensis]|uniref:Uncharacterized protein n=1 Tax=Laribacter hongkongensis TaxID=168471 RepID=A0A248LHV2_9NEIS|nr:hypothetical protein LHGZ1_1248 [Laribacter hongkongensis]